MCKAGLHHNITCFVNILGSASFFCAQLARRVTEITTVRQRVGDLARMTPAAIVDFMRGPGFPTVQARLFSCLRVLQKHHQFRFFASAAEISPGNQPCKQPANPVEMCYRHVVHLNVTSVSHPAHKYLAGPYAHKQCLAGCCRRDSLYVKTAPDFLHSTKAEPGPAGGCRHVQLGSVWQ